MIILGFESSCDETGVAIVCTERGLISHKLHSQIDMHKQYGGVVPELASRDHIRRIIPLTQQALDEANLSHSDIDAVAYTAGPGLAGALLVGASVAQGYAWANQLPTIAIHHLEGHLLSPLLATPAPQFPFIALLVSGGHTQIMQVNAVGDYKMLGETLDDAAGEAFDKTAMLLGLGYPGGPALSKLAQSGDPKVFKFPRPMIHSKDLDFSFSGLKTAVLTQTKKIELEKGMISGNDKANLAASAQEAIVDVLATKSIKALKQSGLKNLVVAGGVGANSSLRTRLTTAAKQLGAKVYFPPLEFCTDNGAMIAFAAALRASHGLIDLNNKNYQFTVKPRWDLDSISVTKN